MGAFTVKVLNIRLDSGKALKKGVQSSERLTRRRQCTRSTIVENEVYVGRGSGE